MLAAACAFPRPLAAQGGAASAPPARPLDARLSAKAPVSLLPADPAAAMVFRDVSGAAPAATAKWSGAVLRVETAARPKFADHVQVKWRFREPVKKGDVLLARFLVRAEYARQESGEAAFEFAVQQAEPEFARHVLLPLSAGPDWALIEVPFTAVRDATPEQGEIRLNFGTIPQAQLAIDEYGMLNSRKSPEKIGEYVALIQRLRAAGAPIDVLGVQGHVGRQVRSPEEVLADLDLLADAGGEIQITEFDINTTDEELQADYTRDFLIALYSHPSVTGFTMWGFWQGRHWKPDAAMLRADWTEKPSAKVWRDLVRGEWRTKVEATTDAVGKMGARGHLGDYEFTVTAGGRVARQTRTLTKDGARLIIQFP